MWRTYGPDTVVKIKKFDCRDIWWILRPDEVHCPDCVLCDVGPGRQSGNFLLTSGRLRNQVVRVQ
jgi:hypothetical protein